MYVVIFWSLIGFCLKHVASEFDGDVVNDNSMSFNLLEILLSQKFPSLRGEMKIVMLAYALLK